MKSHRITTLMVLQLELSTRRNSPNTQLSPNRVDTASTDWSCFCGEELGCRFSLEVWRQPPSGGLLISFFEGEMVILDESEHLFCLYSNHDQAKNTLIRTFLIFILESPIFCALVLLADSTTRAMNKNRIQLATIPIATGPQNVASPQGYLMKHLKI